MPQKIKKGKTICITSAKGGVGKTITTLNLAGIYETMEKKVLIIDLDLTNGSIALSLNKTYTKSIYTMFEDINLNNYTNFTDYITTYDKFIDILPCPIDPREATKINSSLIDVILERASFIYDIILVDTTHILNEINLYTMDKADEILYIITNDPFTLKNMKSIITIFNDLSLKKYHILLNDSVNPFKGYYSLFDIKNIIKSNIDYTITTNFFISDIDKYLLKGKIVTLEPKLSQVFNKDYTAIMNMALDLIARNDQNEK